jgi:flagellar motor protein MotB
MIGGFFQLGYDQTILEYWGLAVGAKLPSPIGSERIAGWYQYNIKTEGDLASSHTAYIIVSLGKHRNEMWGRKKRRAPAKRDDSGRKGDRLERLRGIKGVKVEEEAEYVRITAEEIAIHFASGSAQLPPEAIATLKEIADFVRAYPDHPVRIEGHTDADPIVGQLKTTFVDNKDLSHARAEAVKDYFVNKEQLPEKLFKARGYGSTRPVAPNDTPANKRKNRRVVITIRK